MRLACRNQWAGLVVALLAGHWGMQEAAAQWAPYSRQPVRTVDRWLGVGYSQGYHWRNPGPNSDYYSPYSDLHSEFQSGFSGEWSEPTPAVLPSEGVAPPYQPQSSWKWGPASPTTSSRVESAAGRKPASNWSGAKSVPRWADRKYSISPAKSPLLR
jgi:hypothetical protein